MSPWLNWLAINFTQLLCKNKSIKYLFKPTGGIAAQIGLSTYFWEHLSMAFFYVSKLKKFVQNLLFWKPTNGCCSRLTSSNVYTVKKMCSRWSCSQFNKIEKAWVRVEIFCFDFPKTQSNQYIKSRKVATFENCEILSNLQFLYVREYKATLSGGNKKVMFF